MNSTSDTIAAIATAPGESGIAIVRLSGPASLSIADQVFTGKTKPSAQSGHTFIHGHIQSKEGALLDEVILLVYRAPCSYTRQDVVEIQCHGGRVTGRRILKALLDAGAAPAQPGEFTYRAFLSGRIDLLQAEAVADLIRAQSDRAATSAIEQLEGRLTSTITRLYDDLIAVAADLEASLDFGENELPVASSEKMRTELNAILNRLDLLLASWEEGHLLREGARVVIAGRPNVGKSTLLNTLLGKQRAIVTDIPGTTRDTIEEQLILNGIPVRLIDTAGLRDAECRIEREGIQRSTSAMEKADLVVYMVDISQNLINEDVASIKAIGKQRCIVVFNKCDLASLPIGSRNDIMTDFRTVETSLTSGTGLEALKAEIASKLDSNPAGQTHASISERHRLVIESVRSRIEAAVGLLSSTTDEFTALAVSELRLGLETFGELTGRTYTSELLNSIFDRFCVGK